MMNRLLPLSRTYFAFIPEQLILIRKHLSYRFQTNNVSRPEPPPKHCRAETFQICCPRRWLRPKIRRASNFLYRQQYILPVTVFLYRVNQPPQRRGRKQHTNRKYGLFRDSDCQAVKSSTEKREKLSRTACGGSG